MHSCSPAPSQVRKYREFGAFLFLFYKCHDGVLLQAMQTLAQGFGLPMFIFSNDIYWTLHHSQEEVVVIPFHDMYVSIKPWIRKQVVMLTFFFLHDTVAAKYLTFLTY